MRFWIIALFARNLGPELIKRAKALCFLKSIYISCPAFVNHYFASGPALPGGGSRLLKSGPAVWYIPGADHFPGDEKWR
jgi:hypothetical protein